MFLGPWACGSECCSSNSNAPDISQKGLIGIQSHQSRKKMSKKAREKPAEAGSASVSPYGSVLGYELVTSQPNRLINLIWPECRTWFIGPWLIYFFRLEKARKSQVLFICLELSRDLRMWHCGQGTSRIIGPKAISSAVLSQWENGALLFVSILTP